MTGCDTTSFFYGRKKKAAWDVWNRFEDVTQVFLLIALTPGELSTDDISKLERFVILLYDKTSELDDANATRKDLFCRKNRQINNIPPTKDALHHHFERVVFQGGFIWGKCDIPSPYLPSPAGWGWENESGVDQMWV